ncbi:MAG: hypothetical protein WAW37_10980 [Syntrophobacteraceae bacterium]
MKDEPAGIRGYSLVPMLRRGNADLTGNLIRDPSVRVCIPTPDGLLPKEIFKLRDY